MTSSLHPRVVARTIIAHAATALMAVVVSAGGSAQQPDRPTASQTAEAGTAAFYHQEPVTPARVRDEARQWLERPRHAAAQQLAARAKAGNGEAIAQVLSDLRNVPGPLQAREAIYVLIASRLQTAEARQALADLVAEEAISIPQAATVAISWGPAAADVLEIFEPALHRDLAARPLDFHDVYWALRVLTTAGRAAAPYQQRVLALTEHKIPSIRINALHCLGALGDSTGPSARTRILEATGDGTFAVRQAALIAAINLADRWTEAEREKILALGPWPVPDREAAEQLDFAERPYEHLIELTVARAIFNEDPAAVAEVLRRVPEQVARSTSLALLAHYVGWLGPRAAGLRHPLAQLAASADREIRDVGAYLQAQIDL
jgi:hypothetical protein